MKPRIFVSAVTRELKTARQLVANTLLALGYEPVWQDIFETSGKDIRPMLREKIDSSSAVLQIVGDAYGAEPPQPDESFGRVSYTQPSLPLLFQMPGLAESTDEVFTKLDQQYREQRKSKVWFLSLDEPIAPYLDELLGPIDKK